MKVHVKSVENFFILTVIVALDTCTAQWNFEESFTELEDLTTSARMSQFSEPVESRSWIWKNYEFDTGVGNREELLVTNVEAWADSKFKNFHNCQYLEHKGAIYFAATKEMRLLLYHFNPKIRKLSLIVELPLFGKIKVFKLMSLFQNIGTPYQKQDIYLTLTLEGTWSNRLQWFILNGQKFVHFWSLELRKPVRSIDYFNFYDQYKLILLYEDEEFFNNKFSLVDIYELKINENNSELQLCDQFLSSRVSSVKVCPPQIDRTLISVQSDNDVILYEYRVENIIKCTVKFFQNITINSLNNVDCFNSGNMDYLISSGVSANLYNFNNNEYRYNENMKYLFKEIGNVKFVCSVPVNTYRDEVILLIQLKNLTVMAFGWQGTEFTPILLPNQVLNYIDLSSVVVIPNYGLFTGNTFIEIKVKLKPLPKPEDEEIEKMLIIQNSLKNTIREQDKIINETRSIKMKVFELNKLYNFSEITVDDLTVNETNDFLISFQSQNFSFYEFESAYNDSEKLLQELETKVTTIENNLPHLITKNNSDIYFKELYIEGSLDIRGTLTVKNLSVDYINDIPLEALMKDCLRKSNTKITGIKSFPTIKFTDDNLKIKNINGVPLTDIAFYDSEDVDYGNIDFSKIRIMEVDGDFNFSRINGVNWKNFSQKLVYKNQKTIVPGTTVISGELTTEFIQMDYLNGLKYPTDYVLKNDPTFADIVGLKSFDTLTVADLQGVQTINGIDANDFIVLNADQTLEHEITFEDLEIEESLEIDGKIVGLAKQEINPDLTLLNSNEVQSLVMFTNLYVTGNVFIEDSLDGSAKWSDFDDLVLNDEENVVISGKKTFLGSVHFEDNLEITEGMINGHPVDEFVTLDTDQVLPNLTKITGNVIFKEVTYRELQNLEDELNSNVDDKGFPLCSNKTFIFHEPPIVDEFSFSYINGNLTGSEFSKRLENKLKNVHFGYLKVNNLIVDNVKPTYVNGVNLEEFKKYRISKTKNDSISGNVTIDYLKVESLNAHFVNHRTPKQIEDMVTEINNMYDKIFSGDLVIDSLNVTKYVVTKNINEIDLMEELGINSIEEFIISNNASIENLVVHGLVNGFNFTKKVQDCLLKTDSNVTIIGPKKFKRIEAKNLQVKYINGHSVDDIVSPDKKQILTGPVKIVGSVKVHNHFNCTGKMNNVPFKNISGVIEKLYDKVYKLNGEILVKGDATIKHLDVFGQIQNKNINEFLDDLIYLNDEKVIITGSKIFTGLINFQNNITIMNELNGINLKPFHENAVLIDRPISIKSAVVFENDVISHDDFVILNSVDVETINDINIDQLMNDVIYLDRPISVLDPITVSNVVFKSDVKIEKWNDVEMDKLFTLKTDQILESPFIANDIYVENIEIKGFVNGYNLTEIYETTFMLSKDQNITGHITFSNNIFVNGDFDSRYVNDVDMTQLVSLSEPGSITGNFIFDSPLTIKGNLTIKGKLNGVDLSKMKTSAVKTYSPSKQIVSGNWIVYGNVSFGRDFYSSGTINNTNVQKLVDDIEGRKKKLESTVADAMDQLRRKCKRLQELEREAENSMYRYKSFEFLKIISSDQGIISVHHFELKDIDHIIVNYESCQLDVYEYDNSGLKLVAGEPTFGIIEQYITLNDEGNLYFVTVGKSECGRSAGNLWRFKNNQFKHVMDLGNVTDAKKLSSDDFVIVVNRRVEEWSVKGIGEGTFEPVIKVPIKETNAKFFSTENDTLLASHDTIYELRSDQLEFQEYENPFSANSLKTFQAGENKKEFIILYEENISSDYVFICDNNLAERKILQTIKTTRPYSFFVLNFEGFKENLLIIPENKRKISIYEYRGIEGFQYHSTIPMKYQKVFNFKLRTHPHLVKKHCLAVVHDNKLIILEAKMYGEKLDMKEKLNCGIL